MDIIARDESSEKPLDKRTCNQCRFAVFEDVGYSNWTVEGTEFSCAKKMHPDGSFDRFYNHHPKLEFAAKCEGFEVGDCVTMDVEREGVDDLTQDQQQVWDLHNGVIENAGQASTTLKLK